MRNFNSPPPRFSHRAFRVRPRTCFALCALLLCSFVWFSVWSLAPAHSQNTNPQVPQGGSATFDATEMQGPDSGCEILDPAGAVVASFPAYSNGGNSNGWNLQVNFHDYNALPGFTVSAPANATLGTGYQVRTASYYWAKGTAFFDVVAGSGTTPTPTPTYPTPTPTSTSPTPTPTSTGTPQVDALIRVEGGANVGDDVYNFDGNGQSVAQTAVAGHAARYFVQLQNESAGSAQIRFTPSAVAAGWTARYFTGEGSGQSEITPYFGYYGYWDSPQLAPGQSVDVRVEIEPSTTLPGGSVLELSLSAADANDGQVRDVVKATTSNSYSSPPPTPTPTVAPTPTTSPTTASQPDAQIRLPGESDAQWRGADIYNLTGAQQTALQFAAAGQSAVFEIKIENDGANPQDFTVQAPATSNGWTLRMFDTGTPQSPTAGTEVTTAATSQNGWTTPTLSPGAARLLRAELSRPTGNTSDGNALIKVNGGNKEDAVRLVSTGQSIGGIEYSLDAGATWQAVAPGGVLQVPRWSTVGFRALKGAPTLAWPNDPFAPVWLQDGVEYCGETMWFYFPDVTAEGMNEVIQARCVNAQAVDVKVLPVAPEGEGVLT